jgi:hypothetical protein
MEKMDLLGMPYSCLYFIENLELNESRLVVVEGINNSKINHYSILKYKTFRTGKLVHFGTN